MVPQMDDNRFSMFMVTVFTFYCADLRRAKSEGSVLMRRSVKLVHFLSNIFCDVKETSNLLAFAYIMFQAAESAVESIDIKSGNYLRPSSWPRNADFRHFDPQRVEAVMEKLCRRRNHVDPQTQLKDCEAMVGLLDHVVTELSHDPDLCSLTLYEPTTDHAIASHNVSHSPLSCYKGRIFKKLHSMVLDLSIFLCAYAAAPTLV